MPLPDAYDDGQLAFYMANVLGSNVTSTLGWTVPASYEEIVNETLLAYGVTDIAEATSIRRLRAIARREAWRAVVEQTVAHYDLTMPDGIRAERNQLHQQAREAYELAKKDAARFTGVYTIPVSARRDDDEYEVAL